MKRKLTRKEFDLLCAHSAEFRDLLWQQNIDPTRILQEVRDLTFLETNKIARIKRIREVLSREEISHRNWESPLRDLLGSTVLFYDCSSKMIGLAAAKKLIELAYEENKV